MVLNIHVDVPFIKVSRAYGRRLILHYIGIVSFFMAVILKTNWRVGPKISIVNILISD